MPCFIEVVYTDSMMSLMTSPMMSGEAELVMFHNYRVVLLSILMSVCVSVSMCVVCVYE